MKIFLSRIFLCVLILQLSFSESFSQSSEVWTEIRDVKSVTIGDRSGIPTEYKTFRLNFPAMVLLLNNAVYDTIPDAYNNGPVIDIPMPDGTISRFRVAYTPVMEPELAAQFPMIRTFTAIGIDDSLAIARLDYTQWGFHALIISPAGWFVVDPASLGNTSEYITFNRSNSVATNPFICETDGNVKRTTPNVDDNLYRSSGATLRNYRLALACTGEYAAYYGGTIAGAASGMVTSVNRVTQVYESELSIRLTLIANNNSLIYTNASTDPYTNGSGSTMLGQNQTNINSVIGSSNYDIGHVFSTGGGGVAYLGCVCSSTNKARGVTGSGAPIGDNFDIDYVAHEIGHQFGGNHTFNSVTGNCGGGNRSSNAAYEPGSGTTIMAYAGICGADNIQPHSDAIFHTKNYDEIQIYTTTGNGSTCDAPITTGNAPPVVTLPANKTIPKLTSFTLTGSATDPNGDPLTYLWEEYDLGPAGSPNSPSGNAPIFRDFTPTSSPSRTFPRIEDIVRNTQTLGEILPSYARNMTFRFTARDNKLNGGGVMHDDNVVTITVVDPSDTFKVTTPNTNISWAGGSVNTVVWKVAGTSSAPVSCANVNILLSIDSGYTFPYTLATNTPNDGSQSITLPVVTSTKARIKVESVGNYFFDMSNVNFTITAGSGLTTITTGSIATANLCAGAAVSVPFTVNTSANAGNIFTAQLSNAAGSFASPVSIGTLTSTTAGTINAVIPGGTAAGSSYRIRVVSSNPVVTGSNNGTNLSIFQTPGAAGIISGFATVCAGQSGVIYTVPAIANATEYVWTVPANVNITSGSTSNSITVTFLSNATSGSITVRGKNNGCGNGTVSSPFNVTVNTVPASAGVISGSNSVCQGQNGVTYSVTAISGATGYAWTLPAGASIASGTNTNSITVNYSLSSVSGTFTVAGTNTCGTGTSSQFSVTVNSTSTASVSISSNAGTTICQGVNVTFNATPVNGGVSPSYQWKINGGNVGGNSSIFNTGLLTNGNIISCVMTSNANCVSNNPALSNNITMTVNPNLPASVNVTANTGTTICAGTNVTFTANPINGGASPSYQWKLNNVDVGTNSSTYSNSSLVNGNYITCIMTSNASCVSGNPATSASLFMTVNPVVSASVNISASPSSTICSGTNVTFTATPLNGGSSPAYQWKVNGTNAGINSTSFSSSSLTNGDIVSCVLTSNASCVSNSPIASNNISMTVNQPVVASVSVSANPGTIICSGTNIMFTAIPVNGGPAPSYQWKLNTVNTGSGGAVFSSSSLTNGDVIACVMTSNATCVTGSPASSNSLILTVNPSVTPGISITAVPGNAICPGTNVTFNAVPSNGGVTPVYQWKNNGLNTGTNSNSFSSSTLADGDLISCEMTSNANCATGNPAVSNTITMAVNSTVTINSFSPTGGNSGASVIINGNGFLTTTAVLFNGVNAIFLVNNNNTLTATVPAGISTGPITIMGCGSGVSGNDFIHVEQVKLNVKVAIEGLQDGTGLMHGVLSPSLSDSVQISLASSSSPYAIEVSVKNALNLSGEADFVFPSSVFSKSYYIVVSHRNCLQAWSSEPVLISDTIMQYDFTNAASKAFGNSLVNVSGTFSLRSGDINQDGIIDLADVSGIELKAELFSIGYVPEDLTGDNMTESSDLSLVENNLMLTISRP